MIWTVAKKELRGYFNSAVAVIFLAAFLAVALYTFFWREKFFARGLADLRPLFEWMPKLLIILVSALAMRLWAEERRAGTLEVLLTLPVARWKLVLGKFVAGLLLIAIALGLTLGLPVTIHAMGALDSGPVVGGYLAALLLSAAYLSIGMCVSAATDNQIVAFVGTAFLCGVAYAVGGDGTHELGRFFGTGIRFESVARGVLDLRDLAYYGSIVAVGVALNVILLARPTWGTGPRARPRRVGMLIGGGLVLANAMALNAWLAPVSRARIDLTQEGTYSLSDATKRILNGLDERLTLRAYLSDKTHPLLAPLVPQVRDLLEEYRRAGGSRLTVEELDPTTPEAKADAKERYDIAPERLRVVSDIERSVLNAYFAIAIEYGDQREVLRLGDLIQERTTDIGKVEITLRNLEYQITKSIKKAVAGFASLDALFAAAPGPIKLIAFQSPAASLPPQWREGPTKLKAVVDKLVRESNGRLSYEVITPKLAAAKTEAERKAAVPEARELVTQYGVQPFSDLLGQQVFYFHLVIQQATGVQAVTLPEELGDAALEKAIVDALKRGAPGFTKIIGLWSPPAPPPMFSEGMAPQRMPPPQEFQRLQEQLGRAYEVRPVTFDAKLADDIDVLVLAGPVDLDAKAVEAIDQFVMRGGALVLLSGRYRLAGMQARGGISLEKVKTGLEDMLKKWGIEVDDEFAMDPRSDTLPVQQVVEGPGGDPVPEVVQRPYAPFVKVIGDDLASGSVITSQLVGAVMHWASPVTAERKVGEDERRVDVLLRSTKRSWLSQELSGEPNFRTYPDTGFAEPTGEGALAARPLAVAVTGGLPSAVAKPAAGGSAAPAAGSRRLLEHSPPDTRIVVFGSSVFATDMIHELAQSLGSDLAAANLQLVHNAVDWALADTDLLSIRAHTPGARALTIEPDDRGMWRNGNLVIAALALAAVVALAWLQRRAVRPVVTPTAKEA